MIALLCANLFAGCLFTGYLVGAVLIFKRLDDNHYIGESTWKALSYTLSLTSTTGEGFICCTNDECKIATVYIGLGGIFLSLLFIALSAITLSHFWSAALRSICSQLAPESCCTKVAVTLFSLLLGMLWFLIFVIIPSLLFWLWNPWEDDPESFCGSGGGFLDYHYSVFVTVMSIGFGDCRLVETDYMSIVYIFCMISHMFLGSIVAFVSRFVNDERTVISDYYMHDGDSTTATTSYRITQEQDGVPQYRGVMI